jgi:hypothetical protein
MVCTAMKDRRGRDFTAWGSFDKESPAERHSTASEAAETVEFQDQRPD